MATYRIDITSDEQTITGATYDTCITGLSMDLNEDPNQIVISTGATNGNFTMHCTANAHEQSREHTYRLVYTYDGGSCEHDIHLVQDGKEPLGTKFILQYMDGTPTYTKECDGNNRIDKTQFENKDYVSACTVDSCVTQLANQAFDGLNNLKKVDMSNSNIDSISEEAFANCINLTDVKFSNKTEAIGIRAFYDCRSLTSVTIPNAVTSIGEGAFVYCRNLASIYIPNIVTSIGVHAFADCNSLTSVTIPNAVTSISDGTFENCRSLTSVTIPNAVTNIDDNAFKNCSGLTSITVNAITPPTLANDKFINSAFKGSTCPIYVPSGSVDAYKASIGWTEYSHRIQAIS